MELSAAYDPAQWLARSRGDLLADSGVVPADLKRTVRRHRKLLNAKKVKHFAHQGVVVDERVTDDHEAQARAVELFYDVFGVKAPKAQGQAQGLAVAVEIDPVSGVVRVIAGTSGSGQAPAVGDGRA